MARLVPWLALVIIIGACGDDDGDPAHEVDASGVRSDVGMAMDAASPDATGTARCGDEELTQWEAKMLAAHNRWRSEVDPPAAEMHRVRWDRQIAANAAAHVASCDPEWDHSSEESRSGVGGYDVLGENLSYCAGSGCTEDASITDGSGMGDGEGWWEEREFYNWADDSSTDITSHYTQMVSSNVYAIGCATQRCDAPGPFGWDGEWWWTICQYGPRGDAFWSGTKPYEMGAGGLVEPPDSVFDAHSGLCR